MMGMQIAFSALVVLIVSVIVVLFANERPKQPFLARIGSAFVVASFLTIPIGLIMAIWQ